MLFDIIVPTHNRYPFLPLFFEKMEFLNRDQYTLWLIDDASPVVDESVIPDWHNIRFLRLTQNLGQAGARNIAIEKGNAPYLISLDDDAWFEAVNNVFDDISKGFRDYPDAGCLMFNIATPISVYNSMENGVELPLHVTCGCAYRRESLAKVNGFSEFLHSGAEETDLSLRLIHAGYKIRFLSIKVFHNFLPGERTREWYLRTRFTTARNDLAVVYMNYPFPYFIIHIFGKAFNHLRFAIKNGQHIFATFLTTIRAIFAFLYWLPRLSRNSLTTEEYRYWRSLKAAQT